MSKFDTCVNNYCIYEVWHTPLNLLLTVKENYKFYLSVQK